MECIWNVYGMHVIYMEFHDVRISILKLCLIAVKPWRFLRKRHNRSSLKHHLINFGIITLF